MNYLIEELKKYIINEKKTENLITLKYNERDGYYLLITNRRCNILRKNLNKLETIMINNIEFKISDLEFNELPKSSNTKITCKKLKELSLENTNYKIQLAKLLKEKFNGKIINQEKWMPHSAYKSYTNIYVKKKIKCAIFLHCFVDAPLNNGGIIFDDYHDWIIKTLDFLKEKKMQKKTIIKPHPNSRCHDHNIYIKKKYPEFIWVDRKVSNYSILIVSFLMFGYYYYYHYISL
jgi:hypothetical protein